MELRGTGFLSYSRYSFFWKLTEELPVYSIMCTIRYCRWYVPTLLIFSTVSVLAHWPLRRRALAFVPPLTSFSLTKTGITYAHAGIPYEQILQGGKDLSSDIQIRVIGSFESGTCKRFEWKTQSKISVNYTWVRIGIGCLDDVFLGILDIKASLAQ